MHAHRLDQPRLALPRRPHGHGRHGLAQLVAAHETARVGVRLAVGHRVPPGVGERRPVERRPLDGGPLVRLLGTDDVDPQAGVRHGLAQVAPQRHPRIVRHPAVLEQQVLDERSHRGLDVHLALDQYAGLRRGHVLDQALRELLVALGLRRDREPQQLRIVEHPDRQDLPVPAPGPGRGRRRLVTEPPEPPQIPRMQLHRGPVVLPLPQHPHNLAQPIDPRSPQHNRHPPITHHPTDTPHPTFPTTAHHRLDLALGPRPSAQEATLCTTSVHLARRRTDLVHKVGLSTGV